jgi:hypothetical protein
MPYKIVKKNKGFILKDIHGRQYERKPIPYKRAIAQEHAIEAHKHATTWGGRYSSGMMRNNRVGCGFKTLDETRALEIAKTERDLKQQQKLLRQAKILRPIHYVPNFITHRILGTERNNAVRNIMDDYKFLKNNALEGIADKKQYIKNLKAGFPLKKDGEL